MARITVNALDRIGRISPLIYGTMLENWGEQGRHAIYGSIWVGEDSSIPNTRGLRSDVLKATQEMGPTIVRWPGGCPADVYHWADGVGPRESRPVSALVAHWSRGVEETNAYGTHEFIDFCRKTGAEPYINVNVGTGTPEEAANWVEYCNRTGRTRYTALRVGNAHPEPFDVRYWGIGNEIYGSWEVGCMTASDYARTVLEYAKVMRMVDPTIKIVAVGHHRRDNWNYPLLKEAGSQIDYLSIHQYYHHEDYYRLVASPLEAEEKLKRLASLIEAVGSSQERSTQIAFDEWNVWHADAGPEAFYQRLTLQDGLFTAGMFNVFHRMCDSVGMANLCDLVNSGPCGPIVTDEQGRLVVNPMYLVFQLYRHHSGDIALQCEVDVDSYDARDASAGPEDAVFQEQMKHVPYLDCSATLDEGTGRLCLAVVNRHKDEDIACEIELRDFVPVGNGRIFELNAADVRSANDFDSPGEVGVSERELAEPAQDMAYVFPRHSVTLLEFASS